jgi:predicted DNA-binding transcriptional regulator YafY
MLNRIERLFALLLWLQIHRQARAKDIANRFEISERTVYRDIKALIAMNIPIVSINGEGYELMPHFMLPPVKLTDDESKAIFMSIQLFLRHSTGKLRFDAESALNKLQQTLSPSALQQLVKSAHILSFYPSQYPIEWDNPMVLLLTQAILDKRLVRFQYQKYESTTTEERLIEPYSLTLSQGAWYINGFCRLRNDLRDFRLSRIEKLECLDEIFQKRMVIPPKTTHMTVRVRFSQEAVRHVHERQHYAYTHTNDEGEFVYEVQDLSEIQNWILSYGSQIKTVTPASLSDWLQEQAQSLINHLT